MEEKDYKKLYEDVVALAKDGLKDGLYLSQSAKAVTEFLFPQLKETEDEKVKRELTRFLINFNNGYYSKPSENEIDSWIKWIDKKCEKKPTDKIEPKFKVGDWITNGKLLVGQVTSFDGEYYHYMQEGVEQPLHISNADNWHLWTIQDANDGDVLAAHECYVIFKEIDGLNIRCYCTYHYLNSESFYIDTLQNKTAFQPATKEQRDLLFQKMKEYGYEWDAEKKELNKIEQKSWSEEDEYQINTILHGLDLKRELYKKEGNQVEEKRYKTQYDWLKSIKDRVQPQPKQEWSEEDEKMLNEIIEDVMPVGECPDYPTEEEKEYFYKGQDKVDWLKSLKPNHWKPSEEQMQALEYAMAYVSKKEDFSVHETIELLYNDLKNFDMTQEEKQILLVDLCARLPYGLKVCHINLSDEMPKVWDLIGMPAPHLADILVEGSHRFAAVNIEESIRPYLRPMSSMTEEEKADLEAYSKQELDKYADAVLNGSDEDTIRYSQVSLIYKDIDWYNAHHIDYRGLIPMGLALEAPEDMYD